ncbi:MAG: flavodoxin domain-containing protein, partial [Chitinophagales bacterium]
MNENGMIVYSSKYGATRQYAEWLAEELHLPLHETENVSAEQLAYADYLLIGTPIFYGSFMIRKWLRKNVLAIRNKKLFLFIVTATSADEVDTRKKFMRHNIPSEIRQDFEFFFLPGRLI